MGGGGERERANSHDSVYKLQLQCEENGEPERIGTIGPSAQLGILPPSQTWTPDTS